MGVRVVIFSYRLAVYEIWRAFSAAAAIAIAAAALLLLQMVNIGDRRENDGDAKGH